MRLWPKKPQSGELRFADVFEKMSGMNKKRREIFL
jgi:hypothetical protein